jgi:hypothetical protein
MPKHDTALRLLVITMGHKLTVVTHVAKTDQRSQASHMWPNQELCSQASHQLHTTNQATRLNPTITQLIMLKVHVAHNHEHIYHDSLHFVDVAQLYL